MDAETERDFTAFVEARTAVLFRTAMALTGHRQQAEDLLQTVLSRAFSRWGELSRGRPEAYLRKAMYLQCVSRWRLRSYGQELLIGTLPDTGEPDQTGRVDLSLALRAALQQLGRKQRAVLVLHYLEDLPDDDISEIIGCRPSTVRSQIARALERLRVLCPELNSPREMEVRR
jgi:RNA polymerase sigma-70 factor (sigma-E family)